MGTKYSSTTVSGYNSAPPPDDGSQTAANRVDWSKVKGKIGDPLNTFASAVNAGLVEAFDYGATGVGSSTTLDGTHNGQFVEVTSAITVTLTDAATLGASWHAYIKNVSSGTVTVKRASGSDTIDETASDITLAAGEARHMAVNAGLDGFLVLGERAASTSTNPIEAWIIPISDETTSLSSTTAAVTFRMPYAFTVTGVRASLATASSSTTPAVQFDINEGGASILSTKLTIDATEKTSTTAATPAVLSDASLADDAEITIDIDHPGAAAKGAKVTIIGRRT